MFRKIITTYEVQLLLIILILSGVSCAPNNSNRSNALPTLISHSIFIAGPDFTGIVDESGEVLWNTERPAARDGFILDNDHALISWADQVLEFNAAREIVFRYTVDTLINQELGTAQRLTNGNTLIAELGPRPRIIEIDPGGKIALEVPLQPETDNAHMQTRMARKLENGNYLVPHLLAFAVKEYSPAGVVVQTLKTDLPALGGRAAENWPFTAVRLPNGNTLVNLTHGNKSVELDAKGSVVWRISNDDFDGQPFDDACGVQRLANGNTVIASYHAKAGIKLFEVTREKEIVWTYSGPFRVHHFQILTTNGTRLKGKLYK